MKLITRALTVVAACMFMAACDDITSGIVVEIEKVPETTEEEDTDPLASQSAYGIYQGDDTRTYVAGKDQYCRKYSASGVQTFAIVNPETKEQLEITGYKKEYAKGDEFTVNVNWREGKKQIFLEQSYTVSVVKENGSKVWLGDGSGNGFVIKK